MKSIFYKKSLFQYKTNTSKQKPIYFNPNNKVTKDTIPINYYNQCFFYNEEYNEEPVINCIYFNVEGYNFIEIIDIHDDKKITVYIVPYAESSEKTISCITTPTPTATTNTTNSATTATPDTCKSYLGNFMFLNKTHLNMLTKFKSIYYDKSNTMCFAHKLSVGPLFNCLHFHVIPETQYKKIYPVVDRGINVIQEIHLLTIINNLNFSETYYNKYDVNIIKY